MAGIVIEGLQKVYGKVTAVAGVSIDIADGEFMVLMGPSGCGKTTILRCLAGLERPEGGRILIGGRDVTHTPPAQRGIAMVFQSYAVFPHMTVFENIAFGLRMRGLPDGEIRLRVGEGAGLLQIDELLERFPAQLSGGQRQRVAVARAIVMQPQVLLMDEPLSNLDALLRLQMRAELKRLHQEVRSTTVYVTHDQVEALSLGGRIAVMRAGRIVQCDTPARVYDAPANRFVGSFIGSPPMNFLPGTLRSQNGGHAVDLKGTRIPLPSSAAATRAAPGAQETPVHVGIRPEHIAVSLTPVPGAVAGRVVVLEPLGAQTLLTVAVGDELVKVTMPVEFSAEAGREIWLRLDPARIRLVDASTGEALSTPGG
jgi:multiple sugar transport system ATP-binding protein